MTRAKGKVSRRLGSYGPHSKLFKGTKKEGRGRDIKREQAEKTRDEKEKDKKHQSLFSLS